MTDRKMLIDHPAMIVVKVKVLDAASQSAHRGSNIQPGMIAMPYVKAYPFKLRSPFIMQLDLSRLMSRYLQSVHSPGIVQLSIIWK
jgi:hypothetical protein